MASKHYNEMQDSSHRWIQVRVMCTHVCMCVLMYAVGVASSVGQGTVIWYYVN